MVDDAVVLGLLWEIEEGCREHSCTPHDMSIDVEGDTLAALCRAWLAVNEAPEVWVGESAVKGEGWQMFGADGFGVTLPFEDNQRVRIVKEVGDD